MGNEISVTKSNALIEASYRLSLGEQRLILASIAQMNPKRPLQKDNRFEITAEKFSKLFDIDERNAYRDLEEASNALLRRVIKTHDGRYREHFNWLLSVKYWDGEGRVTLSFSPLVVPYLTMIQGHYTRYRLSQISNLKSVYSIRLLEMLMQFQHTGKLVITVDEFKDRLELKNKYKRFFDFQRRVIDPAVRELQEKSKMKISWESISQKRKARVLEFTFDLDKASE